MSLGDYAPQGPSADEADTTIMREILPQRSEERQGDTKLKLLLARLGVLALVAVNVRGTSPGEALKIRGDGVWMLIGHEP